MGKGRAEDDGAGGELLRIPLELIMVTEDNKRVIDEGAADFKALVESIASQGVLIPVHVRPHPEKKGCYELRAGERRLRACQALVAGRAAELGADPGRFKSIPAVLREMTDQEARLLTWQENFERKDLRPLEAAAMIGSLVEIFDGDAGAVARALGYGRTKVAQALQIERGLAKRWRDEAGKPGSPVAGWAAESLALVARLPEDSQIELWKNITRFRGTDELRDLRLEDLRERIESAIRPLDGVEWDLDDAKLFPKGGACRKCAKRSACQPDLWPEAGKRGKPIDRCLDGACFDEKRGRWIEKRIAEISQATGQKPVLVEGKNSRVSYGEEQAASKRFGGFVGEYSYQTAKTGEKGARLALVVVGPGAGREIWIRDRDTGGRRIASAPVRKTLAQKKKELDNRRWTEVIRRLQERIVNSSVADFAETAGNRHYAVIVALAAAFGLRPEDDPDTGDWKAVDAVLGKSPALTAAVEALWARVRETLSERLSYQYRPASQLPEEYRKEARRTAELLGIDLTEIMKAVSGEKGFTVPKSWAAEEGKSGKAGKAGKPAAAKATKKSREKKGGGSRSALCPSCRHTTGVATDTQFCQPCPQDKGGDPEDADEDAGDDEDRDSGDSDDE